MKETTNSGIKNYFEANRIYLKSNLLLLLVFICIGILYRLEAEYIFYGTSFLILFMFVTSAMHYRTVMIEKEKEEPIVKDEKDEVWEKMREKEDFFALWAHQIKTPIAALKLLMEDDEADVGEEKRQLFKIEGYVDMALNYLRFEDMSGDLVLSGCDLFSMVKQVVKKYSTIFIHKHLSIKMDGLRVNVLTDEKWFCFVLEQVLSNALKYTKEGGVTISAASDENGTRLYIADTGVGIKAEDLPRVFEKGYTGYNGRMDKKASGLGLYLCKGVCDKLGHRISIESWEGEGCTVIIHIPSEKLVDSDMRKS